MKSIQVRSQGGDQGVQFIRSIPIVGPRLLQRLAQVPQRLRDRELYACKMPVEQAAAQIDYMLIGNLVQTEVEESRPVPVQRRRCLERSIEHDEWQRLF